VSSSSVDENKLPSPAPPSPVLPPPFGRGESSTESAGEQLVEALVSLDHTHFHP
jgi:hypothetical protein